MSSSDVRGQRLDVVIVGAGFGGLYAAYKFREMGLKIAAFEAVQTERHPAITSALNHRHFLSF